MLMMGKFLEGVCTKIATPQFTRKLYMEVGTAIAEEVLRTTIMGKNRASEMGSEGLTGISAAVDLLDKKSQEETHKIAYSTSVKTLVKGLAAGATITLAAEAAKNATKAVLDKINQDPKEQQELMKHMMNDDAEIEASFKKIQENDPISESIFQLEVEESYEKYDFTNTMLSREKRISAAEKNLENEERKLQEMENKLKEFAEKTPPQVSISDSIKLTASISPPVDPAISAAFIKGAISYNAMQQIFNFDSSIAAKLASNLSNPSSHLGTRAIFQPLHHAKTHEDVSKKITGMLGYNPAGIAQQLAINSITSGTSIFSHSIPNFNMVSPDKPKVKL